MDVLQEKTQISSDPFKVGKSCTESAETLCFKAFQPRSEKVGNRSEESWVMGVGCLVLVVARASGWSELLAISQHPAPRIQQPPIISGKVVNHSQMSKSTFSVWIGKC
jgi:hypothetical protein